MRYGFWGGTVNAASERHVTHELQAWQAYLVWMTGYFSLGVWSSIALTFAPGITPTQVYGWVSKGSGPVADPLLGGTGAGIV